MRVFFWIIIFCAGVNITFAQIAPDAILSQKLEGKSKFQDIKSTVWKHLTDKLKTLDSRDTVGRKAVLRQMKMWNRQFWINEYYTNEKGEVVDANQLNITGNNAKKREESKTLGNRSQPQNWILQGPTLSDEGQGRIDKLVFHPTDPNIIFAGSPHGGLFKSENGGTSWNPLGDFLPSLGVAGIVIHPTNPNIIFVLSGDSQSSNGGFVDAYGYRSESDGIYKSIDGGETWRKINGFPGLTPIPSFRGRQLIMHPTNHQLMLAATDIGLFRSQDQGISWSRVSDIINIWDVKFKPNDLQTVYMVGNSSFWKSTNSGEMWDPISITGLSESTRISLAVTPANPNRVALLAGKHVGGAGELIGIFVSDNSGMNFFNRYSDNGSSLFNCYNPLGNNLSSQINYNNTIAISPINPDVFVVGGLCIWSSDNGGFDWNQETLYDSSLPLGEYIHPDQHILNYHPSGTLYCGNDGGIYKSTDDGDDWEYVSNGLSITQFYHFERENDKFTVDHEGRIWGGAQDNGVQEQVWPGGEYGLYHGGDGYDVMTDRSTLVQNGNQDDKYYTVNEHVYADCVVDCDITPPENEIRKEFFGNLAMSPADEDVIYAGFESFVYYSENRGSDWSNINVRGNWCLSTCQSNPNVLYAAGTNQLTRVDLTDPNAPNIANLTQNILTAGWDSLKITDIDVSTLNESEVYISIGGSKADSKVLRSLDDGATWQNWTFNLPNVPIFCIKLDASFGVYVGTSIGVYYKRNAVNYWEPFSNGLPPVPVTEIELWPVVNPLNPPLHSPPSSEIWISTFGRGIWFTQQYEASCPATIALSGTALGSTYSVATTLITSNQKVNAPGANIKYNIDPGGQIKLTLGFRASLENGAKFTASSTGCGGEVNPLKPNKTQHTEMVKEKIEPQKKE